MPDQCGIGSVSPDFSYASYTHHQSARSFQVTLEGFGLDDGFGAASAAAPLREARSSRAVFASTRVVALLVAIVDQY